MAFDSFWRTCLLFAHDLEAIHTHIGGRRVGVAHRRFSVVGLHAAPAEQKAVARAYELVGAVLEPAVQKAPQNFAGDRLQQDEDLVVVAGQLRETGHPSVLGERGAVDELVEDQLPGVGFEVVGQVLADLGERRLLCGRRGRR